MIKARELWHLGVSVQLHAEGVLLLHHLHVRGAVLLPALKLLLQGLQAEAHDDYYRHAS